MLWGVLKDLLARNAAVGDWQHPLWLGLVVRLIAERCAYWMAYAESSREERRGTRVSLSGYVDVSRVVVRCPLRTSLGAWRYSLRDPSGSNLTGESGRGFRLGPGVCESCALATPSRSTRRTGIASRRSLPTATPHKGTSGGPRSCCCPLVGRHGRDHASDRHVEDLRVALAGALRH